jgi:valyl-tRNA synthetase
VGRFLSSFETLQERPAQLEASDRWILAELAKLAEECKRGYNDYNFFVPANAIRDFTWNVFAAHYIEMVKARAYEDRPGHASALYTLHKVFSTILLLLAPLTPFISEELWTKMYSEKSVHHQQLPEIKEDLEFAKHTKAITDFNSLVWNKKKETISTETGKPLSLKDPIEMAVPDELLQFASDLTAMHNLIRK